MSEPLGYFISFRTYGTWLPGDERGAVDRRHSQYDTPKMAENVLTEMRHFERMKEEALVFTAGQREIVERTIREVCEHRRWHIHALNVRTNHVHVVVLAMEHTPERVMNDFKAYATRRLVEAGEVPKGKTVWSRHGSTRTVWDEKGLAGAVGYVVNAQD